MDLFYNTHFIIIILLLLINTRKPYEFILQYPYYLFYNTHTMKLMCQKCNINKATFLHDMKKRSQSQYEYHNIYIIHFILSKLNIPHISVKIYPKYFEQYLPMK